MERKKRVSRKKLLKEPDEFITISGKLLAFVVKKKIPMFWALGIFVAMTILMFGIQYFMNTAENNASGMLDQLMVNYSRLVEEKGQVKAYLDMDKDFQDLLNKYGGRRVGKFARLYYGDICFDAGEYDKAIAQYQHALEDFKRISPYENLILKSMGYSYEEKKDFSAAVKNFEKILSEPDPLMKDEVLFALARIYMSMGQREKGIDAYKKLIAGYPDSMFIDVAKHNVLN